MLHHPWECCCKVGHVLHAPACQLLVCAQFLVTHALLYPGWEHHTTSDHYKSIAGVCNPVPLHFWLLLIMGTCGWHEGIKAPHQPHDEVYKMNNLFHHRTCHLYTSQAISSSIS